MFKNRKNFPIFNQNNIIFFDNASTTHKPIQVINAITDFYEKYNSNIHRGYYALGEKSTDLFENSRNKIAKFINSDNNEIIFTTGTTGGINLVALSWASLYLKKDDEIIVSALEHHSNLIPWQQLAVKCGIKLKIIPITNTGYLNIEEYYKLLNNKTKLVAITHVSNVLGTHIDLDIIIKNAHSFGAKVLIDAAQSVSHQKIDVKKMDADFLVFSAHKMFGPTGIGAAYIKKEIQDIMKPYQFGGGMVFESDYFESYWLKPPHIFESGTQPIAQVIGFGAAIDYINFNINFEELKKHEALLCSYLIDQLLEFKNIKILGPIDQLKQQGHLVSFTIDDIHPHDIAAYLNVYNICVRAGHHCAQPLHKSLGINGSLRISFAVYNNIDEVELFIAALKNILIYNKTYHQINLDLI